MRVVENSAQRRADVVNVVGPLLQIYCTVGIICACSGIQSNNLRDQPARADESNASNHASEGTKTLRAGSSAIPHLSVERGTAQ